MHVLVISRGIPDERYPLYGVFEFDQAKALAKAGIRVTFFAVDLRSIRRKRKFGIHAGANDGVDWYRIDMPLGKVSSPLLLTVRTWALNKLYRRVFRGVKPDLLHAHFISSSYAAARLAEKEHLPLVITEHSSEMNKAIVKPQLLKIVKDTYSKADILIAVGSGLAKSIQEKTSCKATVVPNIIGAEEFFQVKTDQKSDSFGFIFTGNLIERKRPVFLVEAFADFLKRHPGTRLGIVGDGELRLELEKKITELGLHNSVKMYGALKRAQIAEVYEQYDCFVLPTVRETFGVVYIEAMAAGLPVIATICGGPEEFVTPDTGILIPPDDKDALLNAMEHMIQSKEKYDSSAIRAYVKNHYSPSIVASQLIGIYKQLLSGSPEL